MAEYVVGIEADTASGEPADLVKLDAVGGRLAVHEVAMSAAQDGPRVRITVTVDSGGPGEALEDALSIVTGACAAVGEPVEFQAGTVYRGDEYDRAIEKEVGR